MLMNAYDFIVLGILLFATIRGAMKGIVWQLAAIAALVLCFVFAAPASAFVAPYIGIEPPLGRWITMLVIYLAFSFFCFAAARGVRGVIERMKFEEYDRHVGALFGLIKGIIFCLVLTFFLVTISSSAARRIRGSLSGDAAAIIMDRLHPVLSGDFHDAIEKYIHVLDTDELDLRYGNEPGHEHDEESDPPGASDPLEAILKKLTVGLDPEVAELVKRALANTSPENRPELIRQLEGLMPGLKRLRALEWIDGKPDTESEYDADRLLVEISAVYADFPSAQEAIRADVRSALAGVPEELIRPILSDWHADLMGLDPDPDPSTGLTTSLDGRILRHLEQARVPLSTLSASLRSRLLESLPR
jgi:membrane protein required for colicin V production